MGKKEKISAFTYLTKTIFFSFLYEPSYFNIIEHHRTMYVYWQQCSKSQKVASAAGFTVAHYHYLRAPVGVNKEDDLTSI